MYKMFKLISMLLLFTMCSAQDSGCRVSQLDSKMRPITKVASQLIWPQNEKQMNEFCSSFPGHLAAARSFMKRCTKGEAKTIVSVAIHTSEKVNVKPLCKKNRQGERNKFISAGKCANAGRDKALKCWTRLISQITGVANVTDPKSRLPIMCCSVNLWKDCFVKVYEEMGGPLCSHDNIEYIDQYLYKGTVEPMNMFCGDYDDSDKCNKFSEFLSRTQNGKVKYYTMFPAVLELFQSL